MPFSTPLGRHSKPGPLDALDNALAILWRHAGGVGFHGVPIAHRRFCGYASPNEREPTPHLRHGYHRGLAEPPLPPCLATGANYRTVLHRLAHRALGDPALQKVRAHPEAQALVITQDKIVSCFLILLAIAVLIALTDPMALKCEWFPETCQVR